jgi:inosine/xanthosine triphosphate pyrophosphatase family protein
LPTFIPGGYTKTWEDMSIEEQQPTAIRRIALEKLDHYLKRQI